MKKGKVKEYDKGRGFGFITGTDNEDYFVHVSGLREHLKAKRTLTRTKCFLRCRFWNEGG